MRAVLLTIGLLFIGPAATAANDSSGRHGMSMFDALKYPLGFNHFEYVNPNAPKGGLVRMEARGTFDTRDHTCDIGGLGVGTDQAVPVG